MTAFDTAWDLLKAEWKLFPKEDDEKHMIDGFRPAGYNTIDLKNLGATTSHVNLPFISQHGDEEDLARNVLDLTAHEGTHEAMAKIGEFYDDPKKDEYPPHITEAIMAARRQGEYSMPVTQLARFMMRFHPQVIQGAYD